MMEEEGNTIDAVNPVGRVERWKNKLLDLSKRNRFLNVRDTRQIVPLACSDIMTLEDKLASDHPFTVKSLYELEEEPSALLAIPPSQWPKTAQDNLRHCFEKKQLLALVTQEELKKRMTGLLRQARTDLEEGGVNTLFLAMGFLEWRESGRTAQSYLAPILLMPVQLKRKTLADGITIQRLDEETVVNVTLLEMLRQFFHLNLEGLEPLPQDDSGVDVPAVLEIFRKAVSGQPGWAVREELRLGLFTFNKFIMWDDLSHRLDQLRAHPLVSHLTEGGGHYDDQIEVFPPEQVGAQVKLDKLYCPMSADSSQLTAVLYSALGKSFVLHGPPGTGKSQTITNIIAHNLALGRRVLFVSEKKAALDVVHHRLSKIGLRPFCLELHSNKSSKGEVLKQFGEAIAVSEAPAPSEWQDTVASLEARRRELNTVLGELHHVCGNGLSAYQCLSWLLQHPGTQPDKLLDKNKQPQTAEELASVRRTLGELAQAIQNLGVDNLGALTCLNAADWTPALEQNVMQAAAALSRTGEALVEAYQHLASLTGVETNSTALDRIQTLLQLGEALPQAPAFLLNTAVESQRDWLAKYIQTAQEHSELAAKLADYRLNAVAEVDWNGVARRLAENERKFFLLRFFANRSLTKEMTACVKRPGGGAFSLLELQGMLPKATRYAELDRSVQAGANQAAQLLGQAWNNGAPDWTAIPAMFDACQRVFDLAAELAPCGTPEHEAILSRIGQGSDTSHATATLTKAIAAYQAAFQELLPFAARLARRKDVAMLARDAADITERQSNLRLALAYLRVRETAESCGLAGAAALLEKKAISPDQLDNAWFTAYCTAVLNHILQEKAILGNFTGKGTEDAIRQFCELDDRYIRLSREIAYAKIASHLPRLNHLSPLEKKQYGVLRHECEKKMRFKPVRQLLEETGYLALRYKPCFLMSPISVAQYLPTGSDYFDLVVFDEASQIPVWDAVGVIARARQLIVVGDPKQMPPTSFFQKLDQSEDDVDYEDLESILDETLAAGVYSAYLNWHYRSRHESLISFSNHHYYGDRLCTFPSAHNSEHLGVHFHFVPTGVYEQNKRINRNEAKELADYVMQRLADPALQNKSLGIVTFSQSQRELVEDTLDQARLAHPELERFFSDELEEPLFVKNLENVQGDERDAIIFSICYAADAEGQFRMNFGALNRAGGERRLNVAITRAKEEVVVFSSIHGDQIDLNRTSATGAAHLRHFLNYAEQGKSESSVSYDQKSDGLPETIAQFLEAKGWQVHRNVGSSAFRVDLGVLDPKRPGEYLLGIECDGPVYAAQRTVRDRDHIRTSVLESLGWRIHRAWSLDWQFDRPHAETALLQALQAAVPEGPA